jgi:ribosomal protein L4
VGGRILLVLAEPTGTGAVEKSFRNLEGVRVVYAGGVGTYDVLLADRVVITAAAVDALEGERPTATAPEPAEEGEGS